MDWHALWKRIASIDSCQCVLEPTIDTRLTAIQELEMFSSQNVPELKCHWFTIGNDLECAKCWAIQVELDILECLRFTMFTNVV